MKIMLVALLGLACLGGCSGFTKADRIEAARTAIVAASQQLSGPVVEVLVAEGIDPATAAKVGDILVRKARAIADRVINKLED